MINLSVINKFLLPTAVVSGFYAAFIFYNALFGYGQMYAETKRVNVQDVGTIDFVSGHYDREGVLHIDSKDGVPVKSEGKLSYYDNSRKSSDFPLYTVKTSTVTQSYYVIHCKRYSFIVDACNKGDREPVALFEKERLSEVMHYVSEIAERNTEK